MRVIKLYLLFFLLSIAACKEHLRLPTEPTAAPQNPLPQVTDEVWITGSVTDASHRCLAGAEVTVSSAGNILGRAMTQCSNAAYAYQVTGMHEGASVNLAIARDGYRSQQLETTLHGDLDGWVRRDFVLETTGGLR